MLALCCVRLGIAARTYSLQPLGLGLLLVLTLDSESVSTDTLSSLGCCNQEGARRVSFHANTFAAPEVEDEDVWDPDGEDGQGVQSNGKARARPGQDVKHWRSFAMPATTSESGWS